MFCIDNLLNFTKHISLDISRLELFCYLLCLSEIHDECSRRLVLVAVSTPPSISLLRLFVSLTYPPFFFITRLLIPLSFGQQVYFCVSFSSLSRHLFLLFLSQNYFKPNFRPSVAQLLRVTACPGQVSLCFVSAYVTGS